MTEYDEIVIREKLQRLAGHGADDDVAYADLLRNVRAAKRRRAVEMIGGLGAVCVLAVGVMSLRAEPERRLVPTGGNVDDVALVESTAAPTTDAATPTATNAPTTTESPTTTTETATTTTVPETTTTVAPEPAVPPTQQDGPVQPTGSTTQTTTKSTTKATTPATPAATAPKPPAVATARQTKVAVYGSITVTLSNGMLSLESKTAVAGATADVRGWGPESVVVRFTAPTGRSTITARAKDGVIVFAVDEKAGDDDVPDVTIDDGDGKANGGTGGDGQDHRDRGDWDDWDGWDAGDSGSGDSGSGDGDPGDETPATGTTPTTDD